MTVRVAIGVDWVRKKGAETNENVRFRIIQNPHFLPNLECDKIRSRMFVLQQAQQAHHQNLFAWLRHGK
jgi:hypothetical protein